MAIGNCSEQLKCEWVWEFNFLLMTYAWDLQSNQCDDPCTCNIDDPPSTPGSYIGETRWTACTEGA